MPSVWVFHRIKVNIHFSIVLYLSLVSQQISMGRHSKELEILAKSYQNPTTNNNDYKRANYELQQLNIKATAVHAHIITRTLCHLCDLTTHNLLRSMH
jgi:hypothetical protein